MEGTIGEIRMFGGNFAPRNWALCNGSLLAIASYNALFSILGTTYGGDGRTSFGLPDMRGRSPIAPGNHPGSLYHWQLGQMAGAETHTLNILEMPAHNHPANFTGTSGNVDIAIPALDDTGNTSEPGPTTSFAKIETGAGEELNVYTPSTPDTTLKPFSAPVNVGGSVTVGNTGANQSFNLIQPISTVNFIICLNGVYPSRN